MTATPNHALQRTAPCVTAPASAAALPPTMQVPRRTPLSLSLGSLGHSSRFPMNAAKQDSEQKSNDDAAFISDAVALPSGTPFGTDTEIISQPMPVAHIVVFRSRIAPQLSHFT